MPIKLQKDKVNLGLQIGLSSTNSSATTSVKTETSAGSRLSAKENVNVEAKQDISLQGSTVSGKNTTMAAGDTLQITAAKNQEIQQTDTKGKHAGVGVTVGLTGKQTGIGVNATVSTGKEKEREYKTTHTGSQLTAEKNLQLSSGKDTGIIGSAASGEKVTVHTGRNLTLESVQDTHTYTDKSKNAGIGAGYGAGIVSVSGGASKQEIQSDYRSVTEQAGIYAGKEGFAI